MTRPTYRELKVGDVIHHYDELTFPTSIYKVSVLNDTTQNIDFDEYARMSYRAARRLYRHVDGSHIHICPRLHPPPSNFHEYDY